MEIETIAYSPDNTYLPDEYWTDDDIAQSIRNEDYWNEFYKQFFYQERNSGKKNWLIISAVVIACIVTLFIILKK